MSEKSEDFLEEYSEPIEVTIPSPLSIGESVWHSEMGIQYQIQRIITVQGWSPPYVLYEVREISLSSTTSLEASTQSSKEAAERARLITNSENSRATAQIREAEMPAEEFPIFWLWEASTPERVAWLQKEADVFNALHSPLFPKVRAQFVQDKKFYLVTEPLPEKSLEISLQQRELSFPDFLLILTQVTQGLIHLHEAGWVPPWIQPSWILLGKPVKLVNLKEVRRLEEEADFGDRDAFAVAIFSIGAILYRFVYGEPLSDVGCSFMERQCPYSGVPQILYRCIGAKEDRYPTLHALHEDLKRLRRRYMPDITYDLLGATIIGLEPSRTSNEDAYGYIEGCVQTEADDFRWVVACIADGMGGMEAGEVASAIAVKRVLQEAVKTIQAVDFSPRSEEQAQWVKNWVYKANEEVCDMMRSKGAKGGTTLSCVFLWGKRLAVAHVGDSRIYLFREADIRLLTRDHSLAAVLALQEGKTGDMEYIRRHPDRNRLTRSLGERTPLPDYFVEGISPEVTQSGILELQNGDTLLLCSDGVWEPVTEGEMLKVLQKHMDDLPRVANEILDRVLQQGAHDNATVLLIRLQERLPIGIMSKTGGEKDVECCPQSPSDTPQG